MKQYDFKTIDDLLKNNMIVKHFAGSHAYGTALPTSDVDFRGLFSADLVNHVTPWFTVEEIEIPSTIEEDTKFYELSRFMSLLVDQNPNIVETLWVDMNDVVFDSETYQFLRSQRNELLSSKVAFTFSGYALSQLKRIKGHNKWINNPQEVDPPKQTDFVSLVQWFGNDKRFKLSLIDFRTDFRLIPYSGNIFGLYPWSGYTTFSDDYTLNTVFEDDHHLVGFPLAIVKFNKEEYKLAKEKWEQYWNWKKNRNEARSSLEEHFGYDTKHAMHLVRLLRMGEEILTDGVVIVKRPDAHELLDIRNGKMEYDDLVEYAESMDLRIREELYKKTALPKKVNIKNAAKILMTAQEMIWYGNRKEGSSV